MRASAERGSGTAAPSPDRFAASSPATKTSLAASCARTSPQRSTFSAAVENAADARRSSARAARSPRRHATRSSAGRRTTTTGSMPRGAPATRRSNALSVSSSAEASGMVELVAEAVNGVDDAPQLRAVLERAAQPADVNVDGSLVALECEPQQQRELTRLERDAGAVDARFARGFVDFQAAETQRRRKGDRARSRAAREGFDARDHLARRERLDDVVVGADLQADDAIDFLRSRRQDENGKLDVLSPQRADDVEPVDHRQTEIEQQQVRAVARRAQSRGSVAGGVAAEPFALEVVDEEVADRLLVLRHHDPHDAHAGDGAPPRAKMVALALVLLQRPFALEHRLAALVDDARSDAQPAALGDDLGDLAARGERIAGHHRGAKVQRLRHVDAA